MSQDPTIGALAIGDDRAVRMLGTQPVVDGQHRGASFAGQRRGDPPVGLWAAQDERAAVQVQQSALRIGAVREHPLAGHSGDVDRGDVGFAGKARQRRSVCVPEVLHAALAGSGTGEALAADELDGFLVRSAHL
jgi:hypothetical protein